MKTTRLKLSTLALAIASSLSAIAVQAAEAAEVSAEDVEVIEVRGIRASNKKNLNTKRFSSSIVDAISAEDIGKFPDKNVAESLQRIAGVSITRDFGEGERVSIRGTAPQLNRTLVNGQNIATTKWWALEPSSRSFNYSLLPSELVSSLEVYKSPEAKIDEGAIGGTVILRTRKPLDLEAGAGFGSAGIRYNDKTESSDPQVSGLYSWKNENETFGVLASVVFQGREQRRDGLEAFGWFDADRADTAASIGQSVPGWDYEKQEGKTASWNWGMGSAYFTQERDRRALDLTLQFRPTDELDLTLNIIDSRLEQTNVNYNYISAHGWAAYMPCTPWNPESDFALCAGIEDYEITDPNGVAALTSYTIGANGYGDYQLNQMQESFARESTLDTRVIDFDATYEGDNYSIHFQTGVTEASGGYDREDMVNFGRASGSVIDIQDNGLINFSFPAELGGAPTDSYQGFDFRAYRWNSRPEKDEEFYAQADFKYDIEGDYLSSIETGLKFRDKEHSQSGVTTEQADYSALLAMNPANFNGAMSPVLHESVSNEGTLDQYRLYDLNVIRAAADAIPGITAIEDKGNVYKLEEDIIAAYVQANIDMGPLKGNVGVRFVETDVSSSAYELTTGEWFTENSSYSDVLPALNLSYNLTEDVIIRGAASKTIARANYADLASTHTLDPNLSGNGGNSKLKPYDATNFDLSVEWYIGDEGLLSVAYFNKDIKSFIYNSSQNVMVNYDCNQDGTVGTDETCPFNMSGPVNGANATNKGYEVSFQMPIGDNFGVITNYTYSDADGEDENGESIDLAGNSKNTVNVTGYFENDDWSARISYNSRSEYLTGFTFGGANTHDDYDQVDASISYNITEDWGISLEAQNLTDSEVFHYQGQKYRPIGLYTFGRSFYLSTNFKF